MSPPAQVQYRFAFVLSAISSVAAVACYYVSTVPYLYPITIYVSGLYLWFPGVLFGLIALQPLLRNPSGWRRIWVLVCCLVGYLQASLVLIGADFYFEDSVLQSLAFLPACALIGGVGGLSIALGLVGSNRIPRPTKRGIRLPLQATALASIGLLSGALSGALMVYWPELPWWLMLFLAYWIWQAACCSVVTYMRRLQAKHSLRKESV